jgi:hypothetical protein
MTNQEMTAETLCHDAAAQRAADRLAGTLLSPGTPTREDSERGSQRKTLGLQTIRHCLYSMPSSLAANFLLHSASAIFELPTYHFWTMAKRDALYLGRIRAFAVCEVFMPKNLTGA